GDRTAGGGERPDEGDGAAVREPRVPGAGGGEDHLVRRAQADGYRGVGGEDRAADPRRVEDPAEPLRGHLPARGAPGRAAGARAAGGPEGPYQHRAGEGDRADFPRVPAQPAGEEDVPGAARGRGGPAVAGVCATLEAGEGGGGPVRGEDGGDYGDARELRAR